MTREDMLDCLHYELENLRVARGSDYSGVEAIEMAINALEAQEKAQIVSNNSPELGKENGELISRHNLEKQLKHRKELFCRNRIEFLGLSKNDKARVDEIDNCIATVINMQSAQPEPIRINLNEPIKVKLTDWGKEIYYHQYDRTNQIAGREICKPRFPREDENGYTEFQLWCFIELYGMHMGMTLPNVIEPLEIVYER